MYYDEIEYYVKRIQKDNIHTRLEDIAVAGNHRKTDPNKLIALYQKQLQEVQGKAYLQKERMTAQDEANLREIARQMRSKAAERRKG